MGANDHIFDHNNESTSVCPQCGRKYSYEEEDQEPGFRMKDSLCCPWCGYQISSSMSVEYMHVKKVDG